MKDRQILIEGLKLGREHTPNANWLAYVDFTRAADEHRFFLINLKENKIEYSWFTSHGSGSGNRSGLNLKFSNKWMSRMSSKGLYKCAETYYSYKFKGLSLRLDGLEPGINSAARKRAIVMHQSSYVSEQYMSSNKLPGRSWGCITLNPKDSEGIVKKLANGSVLYIHG